MKKMNIYGTLGPSCHTVEAIKEMFQLGATGMRLNLSHGSLCDHEEWIRNFHIAAKQCHISPELLIDMQGPELRTSSTISPIELNTGDIVPINVLGFPDCLQPHLQSGMHILADDGRILLETLENNKVKVLRGGQLEARKSLAVQGIEIPLPVLTKEDIENLSHARQYGITGIMQPFVRNAEDLQQVQKYIDLYGLKNIRLYAKIESDQGISMIESLFPYCDELIIARGDLADSVGLVNVASAQHHIEKLCHKYSMPYMIVTQMMHSMISSPVPTRAEISDVYHAVYGGASSIMLTGETAAGSYPAEAMKYFVQTAKTALADRESDQDSFS